MKWPITQTTIDSESLLPGMMPNFICKIYHDLPTLQLTNIQVENPLLVKESSLPRGHFPRNHVMCSSECIPGKSHGTPDARHQINPFPMSQGPSRGPTQVVSRWASPARRSPKCPELSQSDGGGRWCFLRMSTYCTSMYSESFLLGRISCAGFWSLLILPLQHHSTSITTSS